MSRQRQIIEGLASQVGIIINGRNPWDITVHDERFFEWVLREKNLGLGKAYMDALWDCTRVDEFIFRILRSRVDLKVLGSFFSLLRFLPGLVCNPQSKKRSHIIAERHYDLGNELFLSFLDPYNQYSCAYFDNTEALGEAQQKKLDLICRKINLTRNDQVLDIGSGWGGFARYAAEHYGCTVTAMNISREQNSYARRFCKGLPVHFAECDYRDIRGSFDKIVSVGMFEHVGRRNYRTFMKKAHEILKEGGIFLLHTIGNNESRRTSDPWTSQYIFPGGELPSMAQISKAVEGLFVAEDWHNIGPHYDKTLMSWYRNFRNAWPRLMERYDETFRRMWEYYLLSCAGAFRARSIQVWQIVFTKYGTSQPACRY